MNISKRLQEAIADAEDTALWAVQHVGAANYAEREREATKRVREAFEKVSKAIINEPKARKEDEWRLAVQRGETLASFEEWAKR
jgi:hypothetical protein